MKIKFGQDMAAGLMFALFGVAALVISKDYNMGTAQLPGTGVLPTILSWCLIAVGTILCLRSILRSDKVIEHARWAPVFCVTIGALAFGLLIDRIGFVPTAIISLTLCALATPQTRWREFVVFLGVMIAFGWAMFLWLLGMPIPTFAFNW